MICPYCLTSHGRKGDVQVKTATVGGVSFWLLKDSVGWYASASTGGSIIRPPGKLDAQQAEAWFADMIERTKQQHERLTAGQLGTLANRQR